jgi:hypothetical protein
MHMGGLGGGGGVRAEWATPLRRGPSSIREYKKC